MKYMWFVEAPGLNAKAIVFDEQVMKEYVESGYTVTAKYQITKIEGSDYLPTNVGDE